MPKRFTPLGCFLERIEPRVTWLTESYIIESRAVQRSRAPWYSGRSRKVYPSTDSRANGCRRALQPGRVTLAKRKRPPTNRPVATIMNGADYRTLLLSDGRLESVHPFFVLGFLRASTRFIFSGTTRYQCVILI